MSYEPKPIPTHQITLPEGLGSLVERLAANHHDVWAKERLATGWRYSPERSDAALTYPCLVPYADLNEAEKQIDRATVLGTLPAR